jgi:hypothetical protein
MDARRLCWAGLAALALVIVQASMAAEFTIEVKAGETTRVETPVSVELPEAKILAGMPMDKSLPLKTLLEQDLVAVTLDGPGGTVPGQLVALDGGKARLWWVIPQLEAGKTGTWKATIERRKPGDVRSFQFKDTKGDHLDLLFGDRKVTRFMYAFEATDDAKKRFPTAKPFTHVFDAAGEKLITSPGGNPYPHHRGIFLGYKVKTPDGKQYDFWHVRNVWQRVEQVEQTIAGPVLGRMTAEIEWEAKTDKPIVVEERTITVYRQDKPEVLLDFVSTLRSAAGDLHLGGDPEHAGCQFRPHFDVAKRGKETKYVHPPGMKPGRGGTKDMPWSTLSYALGDSRFNVAHLNHPSNPKGTIYSAYRPYGRFGAWAAADLPADKPLTLRYRIYVREGQDAALTVEEAQRLYADFAAPPEATVK